MMTLVGNEKITMHNDDGSSQVHYYFICRRNAASIVLPTKLNQLNKDEGELRLLSRILCDFLLFIRCAHHNELMLDYPSTADFGA